MNAWDWLRALTVLLYAVLVGQTLATVWYYMKVRHYEHVATSKKAGLIPLHVVLVGSMFLYWAGLGVYENIVRLGDDPTFYVVGNPIAMLVSNVAVFLIVKFERRRYAHALDRYERRQPPRQ